MNHSQAKTALGLPPNATSEDIEMAWRKLRTKHHPDKGGNEETFKKIKDAYETLQKPEKTDGHTFFKHYNMNDSHFVNIEEVFNQFRGGQRFNQNAYVEQKFITIDIVDAFKGKTFNLFIPNVSGSRQITVSPGTIDDTHIATIDVDTHKIAIFARVVSDKYTINWGDLEHSKFGDVTRKEEVSPFLMMMGGWHETKTLDGTIVEIRIPRGLQTNSLLKIKGKGFWKDQRCQDRGDEYLRVIPHIQKLEDIPVEVIREFISEVDKVISGDKKDASVGNGEASTS